MLYSLAEGTPLLTSVRQKFRDTQAISPDLSPFNELGLARTANSPAQGFQKPMIEEYTPNYDQEPEIILELFLKKGVLGAVGALKPHWLDYAASCRASHTHRNKRITVDTDQSTQHGATSDKQMTFQYYTSCL